MPAEPPVDRKSGLDGAAICLPQSWGQRQIEARCAETKDERESPSPFPHSPRTLILLWNPCRGLKIAVAVAVGGGAVTGNRWGGIRGSGCQIWRQCVSQ